MIAREYKKDTVLLVDDEPEYLDWLIDYFGANGLSVETALDVGQAVELANKADYRMYMIDLNIPSGNWNPPASDSSTTYEQYKGLYFIRYVRTQSQSGARVLAYSAHQNSDIEAVITKLYCQYVLKGRAKEIKSAISEVLSNDPKNKLRDKSGQ